MRILLAKHTWYVFVAVLVAVISSVLLFAQTNKNDTKRVTVTAEIGTVTETVSVSGAVEAKNTAALAFPVTGVVTDVFVEEGAEVTVGEVLATLGSAALVAERNQASAALKVAQAQLAETVAGASAETRSLALSKLASAEAALERTKTDEALKVANARKALLSNQLEAVPMNADKNAAAPSISGSYHCDTEGTYELRFYSAKAESGYAVTYTGLETGNTPAYSDHPGALGTCGLYLQLASGDLYGNSDWTITIPNTRASAYTTFKNAYDLANEQAASAITAAENAVAVAREEAGVTTAGARNETVAQKQGLVAEAAARVAAIDAQLKDRSIVAPFSGLVTDVDVIAGETVGATPVITVLARDAFKLVARIPEIDITKVAEGQRVDVTFDALANEPQHGSITYISPLATQIDGVAYFETTIKLDDTPAWLRSGLNADVDIITGSQDNVVRLPKRFVSLTDGAASVAVMRDGRVVPTPVTIVFTGNDGFVAVDGLPAGTTVVAP